jgi:PMP-22/EMP/MP20/Claudin family.
MEKRETTCFIFLTIAVAVCFNASCFGVQWIKISNTYSSFTVDIGLWRICEKVQERNKCYDIISIHFGGWFWATRILMILAVLLSFVALAMAVLALFTEKIVGPLIFIVLVISSGCGMIAAAIFTMKFNKSFFMELNFSMTLGWSYALILVGCICVLLSSCLDCILYRPTATNTAATTVAMSTA